MDTPYARFWSKVHKDPGDGCWEWTAGRARRPDGQLSYGMFGWHGRSVPAHRVSWEMALGPIPDGLWVLHHCDNQGCVRPDHLYLGTHADNTRDAVVRNRMSRGEQVGSHKLRDVDVRAIRAVAEAGFPSEVIGPFFGVSGRTVRLILRGERWSHVPKT